MKENYLPLYRKYRPQTLNELVGQEHIKQALINSINLNKISHAYLFTGPRGTGKTSTARILAKSLNCTNGPTITPCGECKSCLDIQNTVPMDVIEIDAASNRSVEDTERIIEKVMYAPVYSKYKIYIIDEVHMLTAHAFNSLLKTLEEPPENVIFILATTEVHKVLDTIKSRCQRFDFRRITTDDIVKHLRIISDKENINITDDALLTIAKSSAGGMRDSLALLDQVSILGQQNAITTDDINQLLGRISFETLNPLVEAIISSNQQNALEILDKIYNTGNEPVQIFTNLLNYLKNLLIVKNSQDKLVIELTQLNEIQVKAIKKQIEKVETHQIISLINKCSDYIKEIKMTNNPKLWLEVGIIDLANLAENTTLDSLQKRLQSLENGETVQAHTSYNTKPITINKPEIIKVAVSQPKQTIETQATTVESETTSNDQEEFSPVPMSKKVDLSSDIGTLWANIMENITSLPTKSLLKQWANPVEITPEKVVVTINSENLLKQFVDGNKRTILLKAVDTFFNQTDTNLIIRLPQADDIKVQQAKVTPVSTNKPQQTVQVNINKIEEKPTTTQEKATTAEEDSNDDEEVMEQAPKKPSSINNSMHSDLTNMTLDVFNGKIIE